MQFDIPIIAGNLLDMLKFNPEAPMLFSSGLFWLLFIIFLPIYASLKQKRWKMMLFVIAFSLYFYYKSSGFFFLMLTATSLIDWILSRAIYASGSKTTKKVFATISICLSLGDGKQQFPATRHYPSCRHLFLHIPIYQLCNRCV